MIMLKNEGSKNARNKQYCLLPCLCILLGIEDIVSNDPGGLRGHIGDDDSTRVGRRGRY